MAQARRTRERAKKQQQKEQDPVHVKDPVYDRLCFYYHACRLETELNRRESLWRQAHLALRTGRLRNESPESGEPLSIELLGMWVALGAQYDPKNPARKGFAVAAWQFPGHDKKFFELLKEGYRRLVGEGERGDRLMAEAYEGPTWAHDFRGRMAAEVFTRPPMELKDLQNKSKEPVKSGYGPRDFAVGHDCIVVTAHGTDYATPRGDDDTQRLIACYRAESEDKVLIRLPRLSTGLDWPAKEILREIAEVAADRSNKVLMAMLPLRPHSEVDPEAMLGLFLRAPAPLVDKIFDPPNLQLRGNVNLGGNSELLLQRMDALRKEASKNPVVLDAANAMSASFRARPEAIDFLITASDRNAMISKAGRAEDDYPALQSLSKRLKVLKAGCPAEFALDAACGEVLATMRALAGTVDWHDLLNPLVQFSRQERLFLGTEKRRDHYLHTLKVFLLGRRLLQAIGSYTAFTRPRWILASLLHDVCSPLQRADEWTNKIIKAFVPTGISCEVSAEKLVDAWRDRGYEQCPIDMLLRIVQARLDSWIYDADPPDHVAKIDGKRFQASVLYLLLQRNHAILAAVGMLRQNESSYPSGGLALPRDPASLLAPSRNDAPGLPLTATSQLIDAASAVILHDPKVWGSLSPGVFELGEPDNSNKEYQVKAVTWALACADVIQEWGRDSWLTSDGRYTVSRDLAASVPKYNTDADVTTVTIKYPARFPEGVIKVCEDGCRLLSRCMSSLTNSPYGQLPGFVLQRLGDGNDIHFYYPTEKTDGGLERVRWNSFKERDLAPDAGKPRRDPRGDNSMGLDCPLPPCDADMSRSLSVAAALYDLLGDDCGVGSIDWWHALSGLVVLDEKEQNLLDLANTHTTEPNAKAMRDAFQVFGEALRAQVRKPRTDVSGADEACLRMLRKLHGFKRVPLAAWHFWGVPESKLQVVRRVSGKHKKVIDQIPPGPFTDADDPPSGNGA